MPSEGSGILVCFCVHCNSVLGEAEAKPDTPLRRCQKKVAQQSRRQKHSQDPGCFAAFLGSRGIHSSSLGPIQGQNFLLQASSKVLSFYNSGMGTRASYYGSHKGPFSLPANVSKPKRNMHTQVTLALQRAGVHPQVVPSLAGLC